MIEPPLPAAAPGRRSNPAMAARISRFDVCAAVGLAGFAASLRAPYLAPASLWVDDAWVTLVTKIHSLAEFRLVSQTAPGFAVLLKGWLALTGFSEAHAQVLPFVFGVVTPAVAYVAFRWLGLGRLAAGSGGLLLVVAPILITESTRVKQYTLDCLCSLVLLVLSMRLLEDVRSRWRWWALAVTGVVALVLSSPSCVLLASGLGVGLLRLYKESRRSLHAAWPPILVAAGWTITWWALVLRSATNDTLRQFWQGYFFTLVDGPEKGFLRAGRIARDFFQSATPLPPSLGVLLVVVAFAIVLRRHRFVGFLLLAPFAFAVLLAAINYAPLGTGRTDTYLYPVLALAVALAVDGIPARLGRRRTAAVLGGAALLAFAAIFGKIRLSYSYPEEDVKPLVAKAESAVRASEGLLVYHDTNFAFALYTTWPIRFVPTSTQPMAFQAPVQLPNVFTLEPHDKNPQAYAPVIDEMLRAYNVIWVAASHTQYRPGDFRSLETLLRDRHLHQTVSYTWKGASLARWSTQ
jgi:hypothetical protein